MSRISVRPFLITKQADGQYPLRTRETCYNSQSYPLVTETPPVEIFPTVTAARAFPSVYFGAKAGEFATT